jgi:outer membrane lipase/esterase
MRGFSRAVDSGNFKPKRAEGGPISRMEIDMKSIAGVFHPVEDRTESVRGVGSSLFANRRCVRMYVTVAALLCAALGAVHPAAAQLRESSGSASASSPAYTSIVVFGDSLSDTGNDALLSSSLYGVSAQVPGPATGYTNGRFTDGTDTVPATRNYNGVWVEQLAAKLTAHPVVMNSLAGGTNYAYGFATTDVGTSVFAYGPYDALQFSVNNMGLQMSTYMGTHPTINSSVLFVVWGGANDLINATSSSDIVNAAARDVALVQQLISAGATDIVVPNLPPLGLVPRFNGSPTTSVPATGAAQGFDQALAAGLAGLAAANPGKTLHIFSLDVYTLFNTIVGPPVMSGFANVTASSQGNSAINPDTYLFWDDLHPTTFGHSLIANAAYTLIGTPVTTATAVTSSNADANLNAAVTLTAAVTATSGTPMGTVTFTDGSTVLGSGLVTGNSTTASVSLSTSSLAAGTHNIVASYAGVNGYVSSNSAAFSEVIVAPTFTASVAPNSMTLARGGIGATTLTLTPAGGYTGNFLITCGTLPAHFSCTPAKASLTVVDATSVATAVTISTDVATAAVDPHHPGGGTAPVLFALAGLPLWGLVSFKRRQRKGKRGLPLLALALLLCCAGVGLTGCAGDSKANDAVDGTYTIPLVVTPATGSATTVNLTVVVDQ